MPLGFYFCPFSFCLHIYTAASKLVKLYWFQIHYFSICHILVFLSYLAKEVSLPKSLLLHPFYGIILATPLYVILSASSINSVSSRIIIIPSYYCSHPQKGTNILLKGVNHDFLQPFLWVFNVRSISCSPFHAKVIQAAHKLNIRPPFHIRFLDLNKHDDSFPIESKLSI